MIIERREFRCEHCNGIKVLNENESEPTVCPFCGIDKFGRIKWTKAWVKVKDDNKKGEK